MKGTLIPLDIVFFGDDKALVDTLSMVPCTADPCPSYVPDGPLLVGPRNPGRNPRPSRPKEPSCRSRD